MIGMLGKQVMDETPAPQLEADQRMEIWVRLILISKDHPRELVYRIMSYYDKSGQLMQPGYSSRGGI
jgi:hypothetical protein